MSYTPLHHKYRPHTFADLVGQEAIARALTNAIKQQQIAPAYLFTGARGTGKTSSARIMAKALNCLASPHPTPTPCGQCELCKTIARGTALDVLEIDAASNTGVDNIRELIERAQFAPVVARYKVYIIDECHMLSSAAFNALLKTLEEPPTRVVFILATTDPQRVLPTIISRCQRYDFRRIPIKSMVDHLTKIANIEGIKIQPLATTLIAQIAQGGLRDAEALLDQLSLLGDEITVDAVWDLVGTVPERDLLLLLENIGQGDIINLLQNLRRILDRGKEPLIVLQNLASLYRDLLLAKMSLDKPEIVTLTDPAWEKLKLISSFFSSEQIVRSQQQLKMSETQLKNTTQPRLWLEITLCELAHILQTQGTTKPVPEPKVIELKPVSQNHSNVVRLESPPKPKPISEPLTTEPISLSDLGNPAQIWQNILEHLPAPTKAIFTNTLQAQILEIRENEILIGLADPQHERRKQELTELAKRKRPELQKAVKQLIEREIGVRYKFVELPTKSKPTEPPLPTSPPSKPTVNNLEEVAIQNLVELFNGQVVSLHEADDHSLEEE
ncbi:MAG: DNA polymerase III subunit gamma/tau [Pseudanabaenaceae cyanobacterium]